MATDLNKFLTKWEHIVDEVIVHTNDGVRHVFTKDGELKNRYKV